MSEREPDALVAHYERVEDSQIASFVERHKAKWKAEGAAAERARIVAWLEHPIPNMHPDDKCREIGTLRRAIRGIVAGKHLTAPGQPTAEPASSGAQEPESRPVPNSGDV